MAIKNPIVYNMALLLEEIAEADTEQVVIRSLYMVTKEVHRLLLSPQGKT